MKRNWFMVLRYLIAPEESRIGRRDYWNSVFLAAQKPFNRVCLEAGKVMFVLTLCVALMMVLGRL